MSHQHGIGAGVSNEEDGACEHSTVMRRPDAWRCLSCDVTFYPSGRGIQDSEAMLMHSITAQRNRLNAALAEIRAQDDHIEILEGILRRTVQDVDNGEANGTGVNQARTVLDLTPPQWEVQS